MSALARYEHVECATRPACPRQSRFTFALVGDHLLDGRELVERTPAAEARVQARFGWRGGRCRVCVGDYDAVLLVPVEGDPAGLLAGWGVSVRAAHRAGDGWRLSHGGEPAEALVLAWDAAEDPGGCRRAFEAACPDGVEKTIGLVAGRPPLRDALHRASYAEWRGLGRMELVPVARSP